MFIPQDQLINDNNLNQSITNKIAILVPVGNYIEPACDEALRQLEKDNIKIYRQYGFSAIDQGRCVMAQTALNDGYEHLFWIDSDISFYYKDIYKIINRNGNNKYPFITSAYCVKGWPVLTTRFYGDQKEIPFGPNIGGLCRVQWAATGFMYTHKKIYENIKLQYNLKPVNIWGGQYVVHPWFFPMILGDQYVGEDFSFCERANNSGIKIYCDTTVKLAHIGKYGYSYAYITRKAPEENLDNIMYIPYPEKINERNKEFIQHGNIL